MFLHDLEGWQLLQESSCMVAIHGWYVHMTQRGKKLEQFLNGNCPIIKFTANYSREEISSLGVAR